MERLEGRTAFITGGASGIGYGLTRTFLHAGMKVIAADVSRDHLDRAAMELTDDPNVHFVQLDVSDRAAVEAAADAAEARYGPVHILCNNAGVGMLGGIKSTTHADWDWVLSVNLGGVVNGIQTFLPRMLAHGEGGHIVNTSSIGALLPGPGGAAYIASKAAVAGLTEALRSDLAEDDIGVTLLIPGPTATNINQVGALRPDRFQDSGLHDIEQQLATSPLFANGMDPMETGALVLDAIRCNKLFVFTHGEFREGVARRFEATLTGFPDDPINEERAKGFGFPTENIIYDDILKAKAAAK